MKDHVEIGHLTKHDAFRMNRDLAMNLEICFKIHTNVANLRQLPPKPYKLLNFFIISVILFKMSKHSECHLIVFQTEGV